MFGDFLLSLKGASEKPVAIEQVKGKAEQVKGKAVKQNVGSQVISRQIVQARSRQISQSSQQVEYLSMESYRKHLPAFYNAFYGINLLRAVELLPALEEVPRMSERQVGQLKREVRVLQKLEGVVGTYAHEMDKLNQDVVVNELQFSRTVLGRGAHSVVRLASSPESPRTYAVKIISLEKIRRKFFIKQDQLIRMMNAEIRILTALKHAPYVVKYYQAIYSEETERLFVVLEHCAKGSLLNLLRQEARRERRPEEARKKSQEAHRKSQEALKERKSEEPLKESLRERKPEHHNFQWHKTLRKYFAQAAHALHCSTLSTIQCTPRTSHTETSSPDNILLAADDTVRLIDFNISEELSYSNHIRIVAGKFVGTKGYSAPELFLQPPHKERYVNAKALDIWSLGISLLEALEKKHPFQAHNFLSIQEQINQQVPISKDYEDSLQTLLKGMLQIQYEKRYTIDQVLKNPWLAQ